MKRVAFRLIEAEQFDALVPFLDNISPARIAAARLVLVDRKSHREVASLVGTTRGNVQSLVDAVWRYYQKYEQSLAIAQKAVVPEGWEHVSMTVPSELALKFRRSLVRFKKNKGLEISKEEKKLMQRRPSNTGLAEMPSMPCNNSRSD